MKKNVTSVTTNHSKLLITSESHLEDILLDNISLQQSRLGSTNSAYGSNLFGTRLTPNTVFIECGNSLRVSHLGVIRLWHFSKFLESILRRHGYNPYSVYFQSDHLPALLVESRYFMIRVGNEDLAIRYGFCSKKKAIYTQNYPSQIAVTKFLETLESAILRTNLNKIFSNKSGLGSFLDRLSTIIYSEELSAMLDKLSLADWYAFLDRNNCEAFGVAVPMQINLSNFFREIFQVQSFPKVVDNVLGRLKQAQFKTPIWKLDGRGRAIRSERWTVDELESQTLIPDVFLRQLLTSSIIPVIRLHGNKYSYQDKIDSLDEQSRGICPLRVFYKAKISSGTKQQIPDRANRPCPIVERLFGSSINLSTVNPMDMVSL